MSTTESVRVSYSAKAKYDWCPRLYRYEKVMKYTPDELPNLYMITGSAVHKSIEQMYTDDVFTLDHLLALWPSRFEKCVSEAGITFKSKTARLRWYNLGASLLEKFHEAAVVHGLLIKPIASEWSFSVEVVAKSGNRFRIIGFVDLIISINGHIFIIDFKTGTHQVTKEELRTNDQLTLYSMAYRRQFNQAEKNVGLFYIRSGEIRWSERTESDYEKVIESIDETWQKIERKEFEPSYKLCHICQFQKRCAAEDLEKKSGVPKGWFFPDLDKELL